MRLNVRECLYRCCEPCYEKQIKWKKKKKKKKYNEENKTQETRATTAKQQPKKKERNKKTNVTPTKTPPWLTITIIIDGGVYDETKEKEKYINTVRWTKTTRHCILLLLFIITICSLTIMLEIKTTLRNDVFLCDLSRCIRSSRSPIHLFYFSSLLIYLMFLYCFY